MSPQPPPERPLPDLAQTREVSCWSGSIEQDGVIVARVYCPTEEAAKNELANYAMMYGQDGPVRVRLRVNYKRRKVSP